MVDISLYGNLVVDRIFDNFIETQRLGGIANAWEALTHMSPDKLVELVPTSVGEAIVLIDRENSKRTSRARLNIKNNDISVANSKWHHVMYLNSVHDLNFLNDVDGIVSADITTGPICNLEYLKYVDYLFVSDEDLFMDLAELAKKTKGWVILHSSTGSICNNGVSQYVLDGVVEYVDGINVLGAGDIFASAFIGSESSMNIVDRIKNAHHKATKLLSIRSDYLKG